MKHKTLIGKTSHHSLIRLGCATACCLLSLQAFAKDGMAKDGLAKKEEPAEEEPPANWIDFTVGDSFLGGREATFQSRARQTDDFYGGLSSLRWEKEMGDLTFLVEGHALFGMEDYDITLGVTKKDVGYIKGGFRQFRTWYDSTGGYLPDVTGGWAPIYGDDELSVDRGELWFEAGLRMEHFPEITFGYSHDWRDGTKDSTIWGRNTAPYPDGPTRAILPTLNQLDERRDTFRLDLTHTLGNTDLGLGLRYESVRNDDTLKIRENPGVTDAASDLSTKQRTVYDSDLFNAHIFSETRFNERMLMSFGYSYTSMDTDTDGSSRIIVDRAGTRSYDNHTFDSLAGGGNLNLNVANANFWWNPIDDLVIVPSFRAEWQDNSAAASFVNDGVKNRNASDSDTNQLTEQLDVRYTGLENLVLYSKVEFSQTDGDITYRYYTYDPDQKKYSHFQSSDITQEKYVVGANWYPLRGLSLSAQYYHKNFNEDYDNSYDPLQKDGNEADADLKTYNYSTDDVNLRLTWRALPNLTLVSRYDYQHTTMENRAYSENQDTGVPFTTDLRQSADITRHIFSQSATWTPVSQMYVQGTFSYVIAETDTPANQYAPQRLTDSDNEYVTANLTVGYALDQKTDIRAGYTYFHSSDFDIPYESPGVPGSVPYGTDLEEHIFSVSLNRRISPRMIWNLGYGYFTSNEGSTGGHSDFSAHLVSTGLQVRF